jgi:glycerate 2-kinase
VKSSSRSRGKKNPPLDGKAARRALERIYHAAVAAADPARILKERVRVAAGDLIAETSGGTRRFTLGRRVYLIGIGKGADRTAPLWRRLLGARLQRGIFIVRDRVMRRSWPRISIFVAGHPLPDERGLNATRRCVELLAQAAPVDSVVVFLMGGASSLLVAPAPGLSLDDKRRTTALLLKSGMAIDEMNAVRKHLSAIKGGGLLRAADPARVVTLAISDVIGNDPAVIGSAPSFYDPTTFKDAWLILRRFKLLDRIPVAVRRRLLCGMRGEIPETVKPGSMLSRRSGYVVLADNRTSLAAAKRQAETLGYATAVLTSKLKGDARLRARELAAKLKLLEKKKSPSRRCLLLGGETTVKVTGKGSGGRNQEFALASAVGLAGVSGVYLLSAASDGSDGPTDAAGAFVDGKTLSRARARRQEARRALKRNDSHRFFARSRDLFRPGPTGTNVLDFIIALVAGSDGHA